MSKGADDPLRHGKYHQRGREGARRGDIGTRKGSGAELATNYELQSTKYDTLESFRTSSFVLRTFCPSLITALPHLSP